MIVEAVSRRSVVGQQEQDVWPAHMRLLEAAPDARHLEVLVHREDRHVVAALAPGPRDAQGEAGLHRRAGSVERERAGLPHLRRRGRAVELVDELQDARPGGERLLALQHPRRVGRLHGVGPAELLNQENELERRREPCHLKDEELGAWEGEVHTDSAERTLGKLAAKDTGTEDLVVPAAAGIGNQELDGTGKQSAHRAGLEPALGRGPGRHLSIRDVQRLGGSEQPRGVGKPHGLKCGGM